MADGFEENVEFFTLTYEAPFVSRATASSRRSLRCCGCAPGRAVRRIDDISKGWASLMHTAFSRTSTGPSIPEALAVRVRGQPSPSSSPTRTGCSSRLHAASGPCRARPALRGVPAQLRDRGRAGHAMKFTLKDYQARRRRRGHDNLAAGVPLTMTAATAQETSFSLTATTGAGKTVMAAAAIEALFYGDDELRLRR